MLKELKEAMEAYAKLPEGWQQYAVYGMKEDFEEIVALMEGGATWDVTDKARYARSWNCLREDRARREPDPRSVGSPESGERDNDRKF